MIRCHLPFSMGKPAGFMGIVADARTFQQSVDRFNGDADIEHPFRILILMTLQVNMTTQPVPALLRVDTAQGGAHAILADVGTQSEQARRAVVSKQGREVRVAVVPGEYAQKLGAQHVAGRMGAVAFVAKRRVSDQRLEGSSRGQILREKHQRT